MRGGSSEAIFWEGPLQGTRAALPSVPYRADLSARVWHRAKFNHKVLKGATSMFDIIRLPSNHDLVGPSRVTNHAAGMVSNLMVRLLLVRLALACCKPRIQVADHRARHKMLAQSVAITAVVGLIGFAIIH